MTATHYPTHLQPHQPSQPMEADELLLVTQPKLRAQLLQARLANKRCANFVIQRGENLYLSLRGVADEERRREVAWAVSRLQMGATLNPRELPDPLRTVLLSAKAPPSPLLASLVWGTICGVIGGVLAMALVGLAMTILNAQPDPFMDFAATAVAFILAGTMIGVSATVYFWRRLSKG